MRRWQASYAVVPPAPNRSIGIRHHRLRRTSRPPQPQLPVGRALTSKPLACLVQAATDVRLPSACSLQRMAFKPALRTEGTLDSVGIARSLLANKISMSDR